jgi:hypothetical protein
VRHDRRACSTSKAGITVIWFQGLIALCGLLGTIWLIDRKAGEAVVAILAGMTGTAIGSLSSMMNNTNTPPAPSSLPVPVQVENKGAAEAVPTERIDGLS